MRRLKSFLKWNNLLLHHSILLYTSSRRKCWKVSLHLLTYTNVTSYRVIRAEIYVFDVWCWITISVEHFNCYLIAVKMQKFSQFLKILFFILAPATQPIWTRISVIVYISQSGPNFSGPYFFVFFFGGGGGGGMVFTGIFFTVPALNINSNLNRYSRNPLLLFKEDQ